MIAELLGLAERGEGEKRGTAPAAPSERLQGPRTRGIGGAAALDGLLQADAGVGTSQTGPKRSLGMVV